MPGSIRLYLPLQLRALHGALAVEVGVRHRDANVSQRRSCLPMQQQMLRGAGFRVVPVHSTQLTGSQKPVARHHAGLCSGGLGNLIADNNQVIAYRQRGPGHRQLLLFVVERVRGHWHRPGCNRRGSQSTGVALGHSAIFLVILSRFFPCLQRNPVGPGVQFRHVAGCHIEPPGLVGNDDVRRRKRHFGPLNFLPQLPRPRRATRLRKPSLGFPRQAHGRHRFGFAGGFGPTGYKLSADG